MQLVTTEGKIRGLQLKQTPRLLMLIKENVRTLKEARQVLVGIGQIVLQQPADS